MRIERRSRAASGPPAGALLAGVLLASGTLAAGWLRLGLAFPTCFLREWTGLPCPTCGTTRMVKALAAGDVYEAIAWNPLVFLGMAAVVVWGILSLGRVVLGLPGWRVVPGPRERLALWVLALVVLTAGWGYLIWRGA